MNLYRNKIISKYILLTGICLLFLFNDFVVAQSDTLIFQKISYKARNKVLHKVLDEISIQTGLEFSYNSDLIPINSIVKVNAENISLKELLCSIIEDSTLSYNIVDKQIIITRKNTLSKLSLTHNVSRENEYFDIAGKVFDNTSKEVMAYANIAVLGKSIGTVTNEQGEYTLKIPDKLLFDTLVISYIGYKNIYIAINQLSENKNNFYLTPDSYFIDEVVIRGYNANEILKEAIKRINKNYYTDPYQITAFYREWVKKESDLAAITEAVIEVYKSPYLGPFSDQVRLLKSRKNEYYAKNDTLALKLKGGLYASLYLDIIKNPSVFLQAEYLSYYNYYVEEILPYNDKLVYVISFKPNAYIEDFAFEGKILIDTEKLTIIALEFNVTPETINKTGHELVVKKAVRTQVKAISAKYIINYREIGDKSFLNFAKGELEFKVKYRRKLFAKNFKTIFEFASNTIDTLQVERFKRAETIPTQNVFIDEDFNYDHLFWDDYNYISPDKSLQDAIIEIQRKIGQLDH